MRAFLRTSKNKHSYHSDRGSLVPKCMFYLKNLSENKVRRYAITDALHLLSMGLLPDTQNCGCACAGNAGNVFPVTAGKRSRHASRHVRHARAVMHAGIANYRFPLKSAAGENVPGIPGACATCNFTYLVRGPWRSSKHLYYKSLNPSAVLNHCGLMTSYGYRELGQHWITKWLVTWRHSSNYLNHFQSLKPYDKNTKTEFTLFS